MCVYRVTVEVKSKATPKVPKAEKMDPQVTCNIGQETQQPASNMGINPYYLPTGPRMPYNCTEPFQLASPIEPTAFFEDREKLMALLSSIQQMLQMQASTVPSTMTKSEPAFDSNVVQFACNQGREKPISAPVQQIIQEKEIITSAEKTEKEVQLDSRATASCSRAATPAQQIQQANAVNASSDETTGKELTLGVTEDLSASRATELDKEGKKVIPNNIQQVAQNNVLGGSIATQNASGVLPTVNAKNLLGMLDIKSELSETQERRRQRPISTLSFQMTKLSS